VRVKYHANSIAGRRFRMQYWGEPWATDGPAADQNLTRRVRSATSIEVGDPIVLTLEDPTLFQHPWIYFVEPGNLELTDPELPILREFLLRAARRRSTISTGRTSGSRWPRSSSACFRTGPSWKWSARTRFTPVSTSWTGFPQIPGLGSFLNGRTWEKGGSCSTFALSMTTAAGP
jgi:hypothetical protein